MAEKKLKRVWDKQVKIAFAVVIAAVVLAVPVGVTFMTAGTPPLSLPRDIFILLC